METEEQTKQTHDFDDVVEGLRDDRESQLPRYNGFIESVIGEAKRVSEQKVKQAFGENIYGND